MRLGVFPYIQKILGGLRPPAPWLTSASRPTPSPPLSKDKFASALVSQTGPASRLHPLRGARLSSQACGSLTICSACLSPAACVPKRPPVPPPPVTLRYNHCVPLRGTDAAASAPDTCPRAWGTPVAGAFCRSAAQIHSGLRPWRCMPPAGRTETQPSPPFDGASARNFPQGDCSKTPRIQNV